MKTNEIKEFSNIRFDEPVLLIEYCSNCHQHNNSLRHDPEKYQQKAIDLKTAIHREFPFFKIVLKPLNTRQKGSLSRLGLFEISLASHDMSEPKLSRFGCPAQACGTGEQCQVAACADQERRAAGLRDLTAAVPGPERAHCA